jgi:N-acetylglucosaminyl-diphospho-decaprenol L-rhamnosyltransferase
MRSTIIPSASHPRCSRRTARSSRTSSKTCLRAAPACGSAFLTGRVRQVASLPPVSVYLVHWNAPDACARSVHAFLAQSGVARVTVIDNASDVRSLAQLRQQLPEGVALRETGQNRGFGGGANTGIREWIDSGDGEWVVVAAHDAIPRAGCVEMLLKAGIEHPRVGLLGAEFGVDHRPAFSAVKGAYLYRSPRGTGYERIAFPHGTLLLFRRACLAEVGLFDERFFAYGETEDLALRARRSGWDSGVVWGAIVENPLRVTGSWATCYMQMRNSILLVRIHRGVMAAVLRSAVALTNTPILAIHSRSRPTAYSTGARLRGIVDAWRGRFGEPPNGRR